jgi:SAM-dependent methyltransferase
VLHFSTVTKEDVVGRWRSLYEARAEGWDFGEFDGRVSEKAPPWSYDMLARESLRGSASAVDLGTGGGEFLQSLADVLPEDMHATEGWAPNSPVARRALEPKGIPVAEYDAERGDALPYPDERFDVVLSRHEAYAATEVARVLKRGGTFLTQQVDGRNLADLAEMFGAGPAYPGVTLAAFRGAAEETGLVVRRAEEWTGTISFVDVDALVSYLRLMPWQLPDDFTVDTYAEQLLTLESSPAPLTFTEARFLLVCEKR